MNTRKLTHTSHVVCVCGVRVCVGVEGGYEERASQPLYWVDTTARTLTTLSLGHTSTRTHTKVRNVCCVCVCVCVREGGVCVCVCVPDVNSAQM